LRNGLPLAWRFIGSTLVIVAGVSFVVGRQSFLEDRQLLERDQFVLGERLVHSGAIYCLEPLAARDYPVIDTFVRDLVDADTDVLQVRVERRGEILSQAGRAGDRGAGVSHHSAPIQLEIAGAESQLFGVLHLTLSKARTEALLSQRAQEIVWFSLASFVVLAGILAGLLRRHLGRPLAILDAHTRALSGGDLQTPIPRVGSAELGRLAGTLEHMRINVRNSQQGLEARNRELVQMGAEKDTALANLTVALDRAQAAERARAEFLANMSHELCTPLNGILGLTDLLARDTPAGESLERVRDVQRSGQEMLHLVRGVLDWSAIENGAIQLEDTTFDMLEMFAEQVDYVRAAAKDKGLVLTGEIASDWDACRRGDRFRVGQILGHLLDNAIKFTEHGEIICRMGPATEGTGVRMEVLDTGPGLGKAKAADWLEPFRQSDGSTTRSHGGAGLGLSICSRLAQLMGGKLTLQGRRCAGLAATLELPLPLGVQESQARDRGQHTPLRVLVVDDNAVNRKLASVVVERGGHEAVQAADGAQALEAVERKSFDVILMDVQMPIMDGFEATRRIRDLERERGAQRVPILAVTAGAFEGGRERCRRAGMDGFLAKPVSYDRLLASVEAAGASLPRAG
jgi:signal transduction histidine kinase/ActR/RegA family two-component response regulator